jgi:hypothetical protein
VDIQQVLLYIKLWVYDLLYLHTYSRTYLPALHIRIFEPYTYRATPKPTIIIPRTSDPHILYYIVTLQQFYGHNGILVIWWWAPQSIESMIHIFTYEDSHIFKSATRLRGSEITSLLKGLQWIRSMWTPQSTAPATYWIKARNHHFGDNIFILWSICLEVSNRRVDLNRANNDQRCIPDILCQISS